MSWCLNSVTNSSNKKEGMAQGTKLQTFMQEMVSLTLVQHNVFHSPSTFLFHSHPQIVRVYLTKYMVTDTRMYEKVTSHEHSPTESNSLGLHHLTTHNHGLWHNHVLKRGQIKVVHIIWWDWDAKGEKVQALPITIVNDLLYLSVSKSHAFVTETQKLNVNQTFRLFC